MGAREHQYFLAGSGVNCGEMVCGTCGTSIDEKTQAWRVYKRTKNYDWAYVTHHRECSNDDGPWIALEKRAADHAARCAELDAEAAALVAKYPGFDVFSAIEDALRHAESTALARTGPRLNAQSDEGPPHD